MDVFVVNMIPKSLSGEQNQDSEPNLAVNPANPLQAAATAFTPDPLSGPLAPIYRTADGGKSWALNLIVPGAGAGVGIYLPTADITLRFGGKSNVLYAGILRADTLALNVLRTGNYVSPATMTVLESRSNEDQPWVQATTAEKVGGTPDRAYVGNNDFNTSPTATVDLSLDSATAPPPAGFAPNALTTRIPTGGQNGPSIRPVIHKDGTVYVASFNWTTPAAIPLTADVVVCRDDNWGQSAPPFGALIDPGDHLAGLRLAPNVQIPWANFAYLGQERVGSHLSIAVDPRDSSVIYLAWADFPTGAPPYTIHLRRSRDRGVTWSGDLRLVPNGINPAIAINEKGHVGFLYQTLTNSGATWETHVEVSKNGFNGQWWTAVLATTPSNAPAFTFHPYLGDYVYLQALHKDFCGVFSANNTPDYANFPNGVIYQRNANFVTKTLLDVDNVTPVPISIDPFFFKVTVKTGEVATAIADNGYFGRVCLRSFADEILTINNPGDGRPQDLQRHRRAGGFRGAERGRLPAHGAPWRSDRPRHPLPSPQPRPEARDGDNHKRRSVWAPHHRRLRRMSRAASEPDSRQRRHIRENLRRQFHRRESAAQQYGSLPADGHRHRFERSRFRRAGGAHLSVVGLAGRLLAGSYPFLLP